MKERLEEKAERLVKEGKVKLISNKRIKIFEVEGTTDKYTVIFKKKGYSCTCKYWSLRQIPCSHILGCMIISRENNIKLLGLLIEGSKYETK